MKWDKFEEVYKGIIAGDKREKEKVQALREACAEFGTSEAGKAE